MPATDSTYVEALAVVPAGADPVLADPVSGAAVPVPAPAPALDE